MPSVLYLHGFASSPQGRKVEALRRILEPEGYRLIAPDLNAPSFANLRFESMVQRGMDAVRQTPPGVIVGSSLGALVALEAVRRGLVAPLVLIAPALGIAHTWTSRIPSEEDPVMVINYATGHEEPIHRAFFVEMESVFPDAMPPPVPVTVIMGRDDESVPWESVRSVWNSWETSGRLASGSRFVDVPGGDHGLLEFVDRIAAEIRAAAR